MIRCRLAHTSDQECSLNISKWFPLLLLDVDVSSPDEKSVITYVSSLYDAFPKVPEGGEGIGANVSIDFSILEASDAVIPS